MKPSLLAVNMFKDYSVGESFKNYDDEQLFSVLNFVREANNFFLGINHEMIVLGMVSFENHLLNILRVRGRSV